MNQKGQGMTEYLILVALISVVSIMIVKGLGKTVSTKYRQMAREIHERVITDPYAFDDK